jgi:ribosomal protein S18 acetylase RimI-like enzyme
LIFREAVVHDTAAIAELVTELGFHASAEDIAARLPILCERGEAPIVADDPSVVGCLTWHGTPVLHRPGPVGRITMLVVASRLRGRGIGRALVDAAEARLLERGCRLIEVTSNEKLAGPHGFYQRLGYERTSHRFAKQVGNSTAR